MIKFLPFIIIPLLILGSLWYLRNLSFKQTLNVPSATSSPLEVPKTVPGASIEDRVKSLEDMIAKLVLQVNNLRAQKTPVVKDTQNEDLTAQITELKARVSVLEKATPQPAGTANKYPLYIPLGAGGGPWGNQDWNTLTEYQASINPDSYSGYTSMQLEVNFRLIEGAGTGSVRLYNVTDSSSVSSQVDTTSTAFGLQSSGTFRLSGGQKTYSVQVKSSQGKDLYIQSARIKVNF